MWLILLEALGAGGVTAQAPNRANTSGASVWRKGRDNRDMWLILLEALGALLILGLIVWWTMFAGRRGGERDDDAAGR